MNIHWSKLGTMSENHEEKRENRPIKFHVKIISLRQSSAVVSSVAVCFLFSSHPYTSWSGKGNFILLFILVEVVCKAIRTSFCILRHVNYFL